MFYSKQLRWRAVALVLLLVASLCSAGGMLLASVRAQNTVSPQDTSRPRRAGEQAAPTPQPTPTPEKDGEAVDEDDVLRVETDLTNVLFTAYDKKSKRLITTLRQEDVRILEDGVPQEIFTFQTQTDLPLSLAILIDTSGSQERTLPDEKAAARAFVDSVIRPQKDEAAVISFTGEATLEQGLTGSVSRVRSAIDKIEFVPPSGYLGGGIVVGGTPPISGSNTSIAGSTALWDALWVTSDEVLSEASEGTRRAIILVTDGIDTSSRVKMQEAVDRAIKSDAVIYSIGIGDSYMEGVDEGSLRKVSERTGGRAYFPRSEAELRDAFAQIQRDLREQYLIAYSSTNKRRDGSFRKIQIDVVSPIENRKDLRLTYRQGYFAKSGAPAAKKK
ncbi:MAG TPA: VWA domain-containing protein [Pyrinomonadaceae bacterium]